jgi:formylglycine-generating enzyme required for sulfatase activity
MTQAASEPNTNPYVGPRTFTEKEGRFFFGRERETRDLTARIVSERLLLFYAQSGAGKSSLLNTRVIPKLRDEERFQVLPVGRVSGELPEGVEEVDNIYAFNLMASLDQSDEHPVRLARVTLTDFLTRLAREIGIDAEGQRVPRWIYRPEILVERPAGGAAQAATGPRFVLIIDQFEEIITSHPGRRRERKAFFRQLNQALLDDPSLWVVLTLREDYVAALDPYAPLLFNRLRTRFRMERLPVSGALVAVKGPAEQAGRPFEPEVAEELVDNLRRIQIGGAREGQGEGIALGDYVEPVHLQIVCRQLWQALPPGGRTIRAGDVQSFGDVDQALIGFYEVTLRTVVDDTGIGQSVLRAWFDGKLITPARTRDLVYRGESETGGLPNSAVEILSDAYLIRADVRGGDVWYQLAHDRLVEPVLDANRTWCETHLSPLQRQAAQWEEEEEGRRSGLLLRDEALVAAAEWAAANEPELTDVERRFLRACHKAQAAAEREQRQALRIRWLAVGATIFGILALIAMFYALGQTRRALTAATAEAEAKGTAVAEADARATEVVVREAAVGTAVAEADAHATAVVVRKTAQAEAVREAYFRAILVTKVSANVERALQAEAEAALAVTEEADARQLAEGLQATVSVLLEDLLSASASSTPVAPPLSTPIAVTPDRTATAAVAVQVATVQAVQRELARVQATQTAAAAVRMSTPTPTQLQSAKETAVAMQDMVFIRGGEFLMGSPQNQGQENERPQHLQDVNDFWLDRYEVTNAQYNECVKDGVCDHPHRNNGSPEVTSSSRADYFTSPTFDQFPVIFVNWDDALTYCKWLRKRLPTEAEWEWAAKGPENYRYPWGHEPEPSDSLANYNENLGDTSRVGKYAPTPLGLYDMAGNVWEWTSSLYTDYPYDPLDGREDPDAEGDRVLRGGSWVDGPDNLRTANRNHRSPRGSLEDSGGALANIGFRCAKSSQ